MGRRTVTHFANRIKRVMSPRHVDDLGRRAGFCNRERLIAPCRPMPGLLAGHAMGRVETLADIHRPFRALFGAMLAYQPFHNHFVLGESVEYLASNATRSHPKRDRKKGRLQFGLEPVSGTP